MDKKTPINPSQTPTVLLPGGGGTAAMCALKSLRMANFQGKIVTTDADPLSPAFFLADAYATLPPISDPRFFDCALEVIEREQVSLILPTSGFDIVVYSQHKAELAHRGVTVIVSDYPALDNCIDKWKFYQLTRERFPLPRTTLDPRLGVEFPCFVKPIRGKGSRGIALCRTEEELARQLESHQDLLIQEYLPGEEYSIDVLSDLQGNPLVAVPRVRLATKEGISVKGRVFHDPYIQQVCMDLARFLSLKGPSCIQMRRAATGEPKFLEVNPRMGGGTIFATLAGINFAQLQITLAAGNTVEIPPFRDLTVLRYYEEVVLEG
ncbi:MAG: ATP-grasp domain-containing protein [Candidatus Binatia bacterium]